MDPKILENRLLLRESSIGFISLNRIINKFIIILKSTNNNINNDIKQLIYDILLYNIEINKIKQSIKSYNKEIINYNNIKLFINNKIIITTNKIDSYNNQLVIEKIIRKSKEEIEILSQVVNQLVPCSLIKKSINEIDYQCNYLSNSLINIQNDIVVRYKQYESLIQSFDLLIASLDPNEHVINNDDDDDDYNENYQLDEQIDEPLDNQIDDQLDNQEDNQLEEQLEDQTDNQVDNKLDSDVMDI